MKPKQLLSFQYVTMQLPVVLPAHESVEFWRLRIRAGLDDMEGSIVHSLVESRAAGLDGMALLLEQKLVQCCMLRHDLSSAVSMEDLEAVMHRLECHASTVQTVQRIARAHLIAYNNDTPEADGDADSQLSNGPSTAGMTDSEDGESEPDDADGDTDM